MTEWLASPDPWLWLASGVLIAVGIAGTVLPALPGSGLVLAGIVLGAWIDDFSRVGGWALGIVVLLALLAWATDYVAALLGAKKAGASREALFGAAIGTVAGVFTGFIGLLFMPLVGATLGEAWALRHRWQGRDTGNRVARVGVATWIGLLIGTAVKLALVFMMVGVFALALLV